ncbi:hypothetical protein [uncultured Massilia sp.]|uniref:hypothetical protein n=1 Tax=uncultured Massilia sp. TaxID=169973 RepID=UPI00258F1840|nr:hypothetical protein [uncultured Massilia sp.]
MHDWNKVVRRGLVSGATSSILSTVALAVLGKKEVGSICASTNVISRWIHGDKAARQRGVSMRCTAPGYLIHHASATFWAILFERCAGKHLDRRTPAGTLGASAATAALARPHQRKRPPEGGLALPIQGSDQNS